MIFQAVSPLEIAILHVLAAIQPGDEQLPIEARIIAIIIAVMFGVVNAIGGKISGETLTKMQGQDRLKRFRQTELAHLKAKRRDPDGNVSDPRSRSRMPWRIVARFAFLEETRDNNRPDNLALRQFRFLLPAPGLFARATTTAMVKWRWRTCRDRGSRCFQRDRSDSVSSHPGEE